MGDDQHPWIRRGEVFTKGPSTYKIPGFKDIPTDFRVALLENSDNPRAVHSSKVPPPPGRGPCTRPSPGQDSECAVQLLMLSPTLPHSSHMTPAPGPA